MQREHGIVAQGRRLRRGEELREGLGVIEAGGVEQREREARLVRVRVRNRVRVRVRNRVRVRVRVKVRVKARVRVRV